jgi:guanosine-3',5'-bis(diphosphate) 3'-pyrophosphohydrolase
MMSIEKYIQYIKDKHGDQKRKGGALYYTHPIAVCEILKKKGFSDEFQITGLFHDLLEDTSATYEEIERMSCLDIAKAVRLLTKEKGYLVDEYFKRINNNYLAKMVKLADRVHNLSTMHLADVAFQKKYINETNRWFVDLSMGTVFEKDILSFLKQYERYLE